MSGKGYSEVARELFLNERYGKTTGLDPACAFHDTVLHVVAGDTEGKIERQGLFDGERFRFLDIFQEDE